MVMSTRVVTNEDVKKYEPMVEKFLRDSVKKNWREASLNPEQGEISLGNTGLTMSDIRQHLLCEVVVALQKYNPEYITKAGRSVKESTFVFTHLTNRIGQAMKRLTKRKYAYGIWMEQIEAVLWEGNSDKE
jgi:hypothetical protein